MRFAVVAALFLLSMITYIDRVAITTAKDPIARELSLSDSAMGAVFSAFALGYALAQIPSGWFADKVGPRLALVAVVTAWSALTALTGWAWSLTSLIVIRFLFGVGEAGAFPGSARAIVNWLPPGERGRANGVLFSGSRLGAAFAFPLLAAMIAQWGWRHSFVVLGAGGVVWAIGWLLWFRDHPSQPLPRAAGAGDGGLSLRDVLRSRQLALAMLQYFASNFTFFICLSWMLPYLKKQYHLTDGEAAAYAMAPLLLGATSQWAAGWLVDRLYRSGLREWSRRIPGILGFGLAAAGILALTGATSPATAVLCFAIATFGADMTISPSWVFCADVAGRNAGSVSGSMNMLGNIGSFVSANAFPFLQGATGSASAYFILAGVLNLVGMCCWFAMRSVNKEGRT
ncbi:MAG TPA: MFS transporter [Solibacterales bacterium]|nr:MFS transporter [Bryobacterales bacterium]